MSVMQNAARPTSVKRRGLLRMAITVAVAAALLLVPAGSLRFWQGWLYIMLMLVFWSYYSFYFLKHDPQLVERRLQTKESSREQKLVQRFLNLGLIFAFIAAGLDFRCGWSRSRFGGVPLWLTLFSQAAAVASYWLVFWVMKTNSFAASVIRVENQQRVISSGPYALVRHPMYAGMSLMLLATPLALGSYASLPFFVSGIPVLIFRLIHEERFLREALPGYAEYCDQTQFRLVPLVW